MVEKVIEQLCIDGESMITTLHGRKKLKNVRVGDEVLAGNGMVDRVVAKDFGKPWSQRHNDFVRIKDGKLSLICTDDHVVNGLPAGQWPTAERVPARSCGDLKLEICDSYVANGFVVQSMFPVYANEKVTAKDAH